LKTILEISYDTDSGINVTDLESKDAPGILNNAATPSWFALCKTFIELDSVGTGVSIRRNKRRSFGERCADRVDY